MNLADARTWFRYRSKMNKKAKGEYILMVFREFSTMISVLVLSMLVVCSSSAWTLEGEPLLSHKCLRVVAMRIMGGNFKSS